MIIGRVLSPVHSLGPGERVCLWTQGCSKKCEGCMSQDLQSEVGSRIDEVILSKIIKKIAQNSDCTGLTISGGEPFEQADSLLKLLELLRDYFDDILVYTGFRLQEIQNGCTSMAGIKCLDYIDVLIDGQYIKALNNPDCVLRGSTNQVIHYLNENKKMYYLEYMKKGRVIENFVHDNMTIITGILNGVSE